MNNYYKKLIDFMKGRKLCFAFFRLCKSNLIKICFPIRQEEKKKKFLS